MIRTLKNRQYYRNQVIVLELEIDKLKNRDSDLMKEMEEEISGLKLELTQAVEETVFDRIYNEYNIDINNIVDIGKFEKYIKRFKKG